MTDRIETDGWAVDASLARFIMDEALPGSGVDPAAFWIGLSAIIHDLAPVNRALLAKRDDLQAQIDAWHQARAGQALDFAAYKAF